MTNTMKSIQINNLSLSYSVMGQGVPIILLHGWGGSSKSLVSLQVRLANLGFTVYNVDLPGFGKSDTPNSPFSLDDYAETIEMLLEKLSVKLPVLFGHSFGGSVGIKIALRKKLAIRKLLLCNSSGIRGARSTKQKALGMLAEVMKRIFTLPGISKLYPRLRKWFYYYILRERDYIDHQDIAGTFQKVVKEDLTPALSNIEVGTLLLWGRYDKATPLSHGKLLNRLIKKSSLKVFDYGHGLPLKRSELIVPEIVKFLR